MAESKYDRIMRIAKNRGFIWPAFEIYGGAAGFYDLGPLGSSLKDKILKKWRQFYIVKEGCLELDSPNILPEKVLEASGHVDHFSDVMIECSMCGATYEVTDLVKEVTGEDVEGRGKEEIKGIIEEKRINCPECGGPLGDIHDFITMFRTAIGPEEDRVAYLRPETAQTIFVNFSRLQRLARRQLPFGVAQIGRGYRNEISPRKGIIRLREFLMAEVEVFHDPENPTHPKFERVKGEKLRLWTAENQNKGLKDYIEIKVEDALNQGIIINELLSYHLAYAKMFLLSLGIPENVIRLREQVAGERAHYSEETWDLEVYTEDFGWVEVAGFAYRTDYDLSRHSEFSNTDLTVYYQEEGEDDGRKILPHVVEPSYGIDRTLYCVLEHSYTETEEKEYFKFDRELAPIEAYVFPLITDDGLPEKSREVLETLKDKGIFAKYDSSGSIGRRYARADEIGVPYCITIDHQTLEDSTVTIRDRDSTEQVRTEINDLPQKIRKLLCKEIEFEEAGSTF